MADEFEAEEEDNEGGETGTGGGVEPREDDGREMACDIEPDGIDDDDNGRDEPSPDKDARRDDEATPFVMAMAAPCVEDELPLWTK